MHICGTCIHSQVVEEYGIGGGCTAHYCCALDPNITCGYCFEPCAEYEPDMEYIEFMGFEED